MIIHRKHRTVKRAGSPIELRKKEFELLELLMERPNQVMSKQQIMDIVWGHGLDANESRVIDNHLCRLRAKLDGGVREKVHYNQIFRIFDKGAGSKHIELKKILMVISILKLQ